jgi:uncharacterized protein (TIGR02246 family)
MALATSDVVEITQLYAAYSLAVDAGDSDAFVACFVPDGVLSASISEPIAGHDALHSFCKGVPNQVPGVRHMPVNVAVSGDGNEATGRCYAMLVIAGSEPKLMGTGQYRDALRRIDGAWKFVRREYSPDR